MRSPHKGLTYGQADSILELGGVSLGYIYVEHTFEDGHWACFSEQANGKWSLISSSKDKYIGVVLKVISCIAT